MGTGTDREIDAPITIGEIGRNVARLTTSVDSLNTRIGQYPQWADVNRVEAGLKAELNSAVNERKLVVDQHAQRIASLEAWQTWVIRITLGLIITGIIGAIFVIKS
jgi:hypothetical protein